MNRIKYIVFSIFYCQVNKKKNVKFGRPAKPLPDNWREVLAEVRCGKKKPVEAMQELGISKSCYYRLYNK